MVGSGWIYDAGAGMTEAVSTIENVVRRDRALVVASLVILTGLCWLYLVVLALEMARGDMTLMGMGEMAAMGMTHASMPWSALTFALMLLMWWIMMIGMMVPSAAPMILLFARVHRKKLADQTPALRTALFTLGYIVAWAVFSLVATAAQWGLGRLSLLTPMMVSTSNLLGAGLFLAAGRYQLSPLKHVCLRHCRSPVTYLASHWRTGHLGAFRMGLGHGLFCVGCCWFLMGLLFFGGVMNLLWVGAIAILVLVEKVAPRGELVGRIGGAIMLCFGVSLLVAPYVVG